MDYRAALIEFYQKHNPDKLREIDLLLAKYRGREEELLHALKVKYGVHRTTPPPQQQPSAPPPSSSPPQPPPKLQEQQEERPKEPEKKFEPPPKQEPIAERAESGEAYQGPLSSSADRGRSAAERAEFWKRELEKRERERSSGSKASGSKFTSKVKKEEPQPEVEYEEEESRSWFSAKVIVPIILILLLAGAVIYIVLNENVRSQISNLLGFSKTEQPHKEDKKAGIEPNVIAQNQDSAKAKASGDFALDDEEDTEGNGAVVKNDQENIRQQARDDEEQNVAERKQTNNPPPDEKVNAGLQRNYWYLSYISVSQESAAKKAVRELRSQGYNNVGYYYIPEYDTRGKRLYKVYIGPYATVEAAERALDDNLRKISPGTYPYLLK